LEVLRFAQRTDSLETQCSWIFMLYRATICASTSQAKI
jgi:hypothetical protein